jgi:ubiquinone/menaquinone biosynthesis C-methylase UbiE
MTAEARYAPAAGRASFTPLYDPAMRLTMRERPGGHGSETMSSPASRRGGCVVDLGAGTGTLAIPLARARPDVTVVAVDGDADVLSLAKNKPGAAAVQWCEGLATALPLTDESADRIVMSLLVHHLQLDAKRAALGEAGRVLRPTGRLHIADWGRPQDPLMRATFAAVQLLDGIDNTRDHAAGRVPRSCARPASASRPCCGCARHGAVSSC